MSDFTDFVQVIVVRDDDPFDKFREFDQFDVDFRYILEVAIINFDLDSRDLL